MPDGEAEEAPLLGHQKGRPRVGVRKYLTENIRVRNAWLPLLICCFVTGLIDGGSYNAWQVFMGMQTGLSVRSELGQVIVTFLREHCIPGLEYRRPTNWQ